MAIPAKALPIRYAARISTTLRLSKTCQQDEGCGEDALDGVDQRQPVKAFVGL